MDLTTIFDPYLESLFLWENWAFEDIPHALAESEDQRAVCLNVASPNHQTDRS
jgi:hypothetical protein